MDGFILVAFAKYWAHDKDIIGILNFMSEWHIRRTFVTFKRVASCDESFGVLAGEVIASSRGGGAHCETVIIGLEN